MKRSIIPDAENIIPVLQDEIRRSHQSRYDHRLHGILLVAQGMSCREVARLLGDAPRTIAYWVNRFEQEGLAGLAEAERPGRPRRLSKEQVDQITSALRQSPSDFGLSAKIWNGKSLSAFIQDQWGIRLSARQCQRLVRQPGLRPDKPPPTTHVYLEE